MCCPWLLPCSCVTGHVSLTIPLLTALYRTHKFNVMRDGRPHWLSLGTYQPAGAAFPLHLCRVAHVYSAHCRMHLDISCSVEDALGWRKLVSSHAAKGAAVDTGQEYPAHLHRVCWSMPYLGAVV